MRLITGCLKPTPTFWLSALSAIEPAHLRRKKSQLREATKIKCHPSLPIHEDLTAFGDKRLKSRNPPALGMMDSDNEWNIHDSWMTEWNDHQLKCELLFTHDPKARPPGFDQPRKVWSQINRIGTGVGNCAHHWYKWGWRDSPQCVCGASDQTVEHMIFECSVTKFNGRVEDLARLSKEAIEYLKKANFNL